MVSGFFPLLFLFSFFFKFFFAGNLKVVSLFVVDFPPSIYAEFVYAFSPKSTWKIPEFQFPLVSHQISIPKQNSGEKKNEFFAAKFWFLGFVSSTGQSLVSPLVIEFVLLHKFTCFCIELRFVSSVSSSIAFSRGNNK